MNILFPGDPASIIVIAVLFAAVAYWGISLWKAWTGIQYERDILDRLSQDDILHRLSEYRRSDDESSSPYDTMLADVAKVDRSSVVVDYVLSLLRAGVEGSRLELPQRIDSAAGELFQENAWLKGILSTFIVIGLFGTLYGLAEALASLSSNNLLNFDPGVVQSLLGQLETALAPSIWGVFFTVVGVVVYGQYIHRVCRPLRTELEQVSLEHWVPALYPTKEQRTQETLEEAQKQLQSNMEAAQRVATFAESVDDELKNFDERITSANAVLGQFGTSVSKLANTAQTFQKSLSTLDAFRSELVGIYQEVSEHQKTFNENQKSFNDLLKQQEKRDQKIFERLGDLEQLQSSWREHLQSSQKTLNGVSGAATEALKSLQDRNDDLIAELSTPIKSELQTVAQNLSKVDESLHQGMERVRKSLGRMEDPLSNSAKRIERIANTFTDSLHNTVQGIRGEVQRKTDEQEKQGVELKRLNDNLEQLIEDQRSLQKLLTQAANGEEKGVVGRFRGIFGS